MPVAFLEPSSISEPPRTKRWTREECEHLSSIGFFAGQHLELIDGELIDRMGKNSPHTNSVLLLHKWLVSVFQFLNVLKEEPIDVAPADNDINEPEPDLAVLRRPRTQLTSRKPRPDEVLFVIEVSDTTLDLDLNKKARLYARAGIADYWVLDVNKRRLIVHREPAAGRYESILVYGEDESIAPLAAPESPFRVVSAFEE